MRPVSRVKIHSPAPVIAIGFKAAFARVMGADTVREKGDIPSGGEVNEVVLMVLHLPELRILPDGQEEPCLIHKPAQAVEIQGAKDFLRHVADKAVCGDEAGHIAKLSTLILRKGKNI